MMNFPIKMITEKVILTTLICLLLLLSSNVIDVSTRAPTFKDWLIAAYSRSYLCLK